MPGLSTRARGLRLPIAVEVSTGDWVNALAWTPDAATVHAAVADGTLWSVVANGGEARAKVDHDGPATCVAVAEHGTVASGGHDGAVRIDGHLASVGDGWVERVAWRPDGARLAAARARTVLLLSPDGTSSTSSAALPATVTSLAWHPRGVLVAAGTYGGVQLLRGRDGQTDTRLAWTGSVLELAISPDGRRLAHGNQDATVHFWELAKLRELEMWGYATKVRELAWRHDSRLLATGGGTSVTVWDFAGKGPEGSKPIELDQHDEPISALAFQPAGELLASGADDGLLLLWHPGAGKRPVAAAALEAAVTCLAWAPDGQRVAAGTADGTIVVCELRPAE